jgi:hypothetical protein
LLQKSEFNPLIGCYVCILQIELGKFDAVELMNEIPSKFEVGAIHELPLPQISDIAAKHNHP